MKAVVSQTAALHIAFWKYDSWYRRAWLIWPQVGAILLASWLLADRGAVPIGKWAKPADCSNASSPGCAATRRVMFFWEDEVSRPTIANQTTVTVDRSAFQNSAAADRRKLSAALGAYYRRDSTRAVDILKSATSTDPNVQFVTALVLLIPNTTDQVRDAQSLLRNAAAAGHRQAGGVLGRILIAGSGGLPKDEVAGRKLIEDAAAAGDTYAMRLAAAGYANREFGGTYDSVKAVDLLRRAADAGEPIAMAQLAYCINTGRGGLARDESKVLDYLRRSAEAGYLSAQFTLGRWFTQRYSNREIEDPSEGIKWYERAYQRGYSITALIDLANAHRYARATPWFDTKRSFELLQLCASYRYLHCQYWLARAYHDGAGTPQDLVKAYAHYTVAKELGRPEAAAEVQKLDGVLQPAAKTSAVQLAASISAGLRPTPRVIFLQSSEAEGPSPWTAATAPLGNVATTQAQVYPSRPITMVVPFAAGGPTDVIARTLAERMRATFGQPVIIENVTGAAGSIAGGRGARAAPDGYTLSIGNWGTHVLNDALYTLSYDPLKDFEPVAGLSSNPLVIVAKKAMPANDLKGLIAWLKANPDKASAATAGAGSTSHIGGVFFQNETATHFQFVPYRGAAPAIQDLVAGQIDLMFDNPTTSLPLVRAGSIKGYAITAKARLAFAPDIPTVDEAGLPGFYISNWTALWVPKGTPKYIIAKLNGAVVDALADAGVRSRLTDIGQEFFPRGQQTPEALAALHKAEIEKWWLIIKTAGIKGE